MSPVIVLFGGSSDERHVSVASAQNVVRTLEGVTPLFQAPHGAVHEVSAATLLAHERPFEADFDPGAPPVHATLEQALDSVAVSGAVVLLAFHGGAGEDGTVQRMLEQRGLPFTGSGSAASAAAFDKDCAKSLVRGQVPLADSRVVRQPGELTDVVSTMFARHPRLVLKPVAGGSSRGLFFLSRNDDPSPVLSQVTALGVPYVVEQFVAGRELTVGVADHGGGLTALPVIEIEMDPERAFDYEGKYLGKGSREICPARIPPALAEAAQAAALAAHRALGCYGYSRTDLVAGPEGVVFLELNTLPGLTRQSLVPQELAAVGIPFRQFLEEQLELAAARPNAER